MINFENLSIIILLLISTIISVSIFNFVQYKKSFFQINEELSKAETTESSKIKILSNLHDYLGDKNDEQIMINNLYFKKKNIGYWYNLFLIVTVPVLIYIVLEQHLSKNVEAFLLFFSLSIVISIVLIIYFIIGKILGKISIKLRRIIEIIAHIAIKNTFLIFSTLTIFLILLYLYMLVLTTLIDKNITIEVFNILISDLSSYKITESTNDTQRSISTLFFSIAISGTVIFTITSLYLIRKEELKKKLSTQAKEYRKWYNENELILHLNITDVLNGDKINRFYNSLTELRSNLNFYTVKEVKIPIQRYKSFIYLIITSYFGGIFTVIVPDDLMNFVFMFFCGICGIFIILAYQIFIDYRA